MRLDQYICSLQLDGLENRSQLKRLQVQVWKNDKALKLSHLVTNGEQLKIRWQEPEYFDERKAVAMDLDILYEDEDLILLNKPQGLAVHGAPSLHEPSLIQGLIAQYQDFAQHFSTAEPQQTEGAEPPDTPFRPGIVHRLDKDTSGVLVVARHTASLRALSEQFAQRQIQKTYYAIVHGRPNQASGHISATLMRDSKAPHRYAVYQAPRLIGCFGGQHMRQEELEEFYAECDPAELPQGLGGLAGLNGRKSTSASKLRNAETEYQLVGSWQLNRQLPGKHGQVVTEQQSFSLLRLRPRTGRTHQLRVHLKHIGCPIVGDPIYGKRQLDRELGLDNLMLHAFRLELQHPQDARPILGQAPCPQHFRNCLQRFISEVIL